MKKDSFVKDALVLTLITLVSGILLGTVYGVTKDTIAATIKAATDASNKKVLEAADYDPDKYQEVLDTAIADGRIAAENGGCELLSATAATDESGAEIGYIIKGQTAGYGGKVIVVVGVSRDDKVTGIAFPETLPETAGLGQKATLPAFYEQFAGKGAKLLVKKGGGAGEDEIDAISGATITSTSVTNTVNAATDFVAEYILK